MRFAAFQTSDFCHFPGVLPSCLSRLVPGRPACLRLFLVAGSTAVLLPPAWTSPFCGGLATCCLACPTLDRAGVWLKTRRRRAKKKGRGGEGRLTTTAPATALLLPPLLLRRRRATTTTDDDNADDRRRRTRRGGPEGGSSDSCCCCSRCAATATSSATTCTTTSRCFAAAAAAWPSGRPGRGQAPQGLADTPG